MREALSPLASGAEEGEMIRRQPSKRTPPRRKPLRSAEEDERLTARELQVLFLFAHGFGTDGVARRLSISTTTVRNHSQRILTKLRVHSRLHAVARAYAIGLLSPPAAVDHRSKA